MPATDSQVNKQTSVNLDNVSVVIPVLGDQVPLAALLSDLSDRSFSKIVVSCGDDTSYDFDIPAETEFIRSVPNRGRQIADAIAQTNSEWIWILHADVRVSTEALRTLAEALCTASWGAFQVQLCGRSRLLAAIGATMNWRSRLTSIYTGDQGVFVRRELLVAIGGYPPIGLMEDVECSRRLRKLSRGSQLPVRLAVSARKWDQEGALKTVFAMWLYRLRYFFGAAPNELARSYYKP